MTNDLARISVSGLSPRESPSHVIQTLDFRRHVVRITRSVGRGLAVVVLAAITVVPARASDWDVPRYNPAVGSRWMIDSADRTADTKSDGGERSTIFNGRAEITIDEKTDKGFRISYVSRQISVEGTSQNVPVMRIYCKMLENVVIRATTDAAGKPVRIDNLDAVKAEIRRSMERALKSGENNPLQLRPLIMMMSDLDAMDAEDAAPFFLEEMVTLAKSQNTRMKKGDVLRSTQPADNPLGHASVKTSFALSDTNVEKGTATYHLVRAFDESSVKDFIHARSKAVLAKSAEGMTPKRLESLIQSTKMSLDGKDFFIVENGMTRDVEETSVTTADAAGEVATKVKSKTIKVTPAP